MPIDTSAVADRLLAIQSHLAHFNCRSVPGFPRLLLLELLVGRCFGNDIREKVEIVYPGNSSSYGCRQLFDPWPLKRSGLRTKIIVLDVSSGFPF